MIDQTEIDSLCKAKGVHPDLLNSIPRRLLQFCFPWLLKLKPEQFTEDYFTSFNDLEVFLDWVPEELLSYTEPQDISKILDVLSHLYNLYNEAANHPQLLNTFHLFMHKDPVTDNPLHTFDLKNKLSMHDLANISIMPKESAQSDFDLLYSTNRLPREARGLTENDIHLGFANYLLQLKKHLTPTGLKLKRTKLSALSLNKIMHNVAQFTALEEELKLFHKEYGTKLFIVENRTLIPKVDADKRALLLYSSSKDAFHLAVEFNNPDLFSSFINRNAKILGLNRKFPSRFAKFCKNWLITNASYQLVTTPDPKNIKKNVQEEGYLLTDAEINNGLILIGQEYENAKQKNNNLKKLHFFPVTSQYTLRELIQKIPDDRPHSYVGIYNPGGHYIFYYIHRWPSGKDTVIVLDSKFRDNYAETKKFFEAMLPNCDFLGLEITQQFNNTDCGVCALQNVEDLVHSLIYPHDHSFLKFEEDYLAINPRDLTINAENQYALDTMRQTRVKWEARFENIKTWQGLAASFDTEKSYDILPIDEPYNFLVDKLSFHFFANQVLAEFKNSNMFKTCLKRIKKEPLNFSLYQELATAEFEKFKGKSKQYKIYRQDKREELLPNLLTNFMKSSVLHATLQSVFFEHLTQLFLNQYKNTLFPNDRYADVNMDQFIEKSRLDYKNFLQENPNIQGFITTANLVDTAESHIINIIKNHALKFRKNEASLELFKDQPLTYAMLQQCVDIWNSKYRISHPSFIKKLQKMIDNRIDSNNPTRKVGLQEEVSESVVTVLKVAIRYYLPKSKGTLKHIIDALDKTTPIRAPLITIDPLAPSTVPTLEEMRDEIRANLTLTESAKSLVLQIIRALILIRDDLQKDSVHLDNKNKSTIKEHYLRNPNQVCFFAQGIALHLENHASWDRAKARFMEIICAIPQVYGVAKKLNIISEFCSKFVDTLCIEGKTMPVFEWAGRLGTLKKVDDILQKANQEAEQYLLSVQKSWSFENKVNFICKHYKGIPCLAIGKNKNEYESTISKKMVIDFLHNLEEKESSLKGGSKKGLIYTYNHYSLNKFKKILSETSLNAPGLNILSKEGDTLLIDACQNGKEEYVQALVDRGVNINLVNKKNESAWEVASRSENWNCSRILEILFDTIPDDQRESQAKKMLEIAYQANNYSAFKKSLSYIDDLNFLNEPRENLKGLTFLQDACKQGKVKEKELESILAKKNRADESVINAKSAFTSFEVIQETVYGTQKTRMSLLRFSLGQGSKKLTHALLEALEEKSQANKFSAYFASKQADYSAFEIWLSSIQDDSILNECFGAETVLTQACQRENLGVIEALLEHNLDLLQTNKNGQTSFMIACEKKNKQIVFTLLEAYKKRNEFDSMLAAKTILLNALEKDVDLFFEVMAYIKEDPKYKICFYAQNMQTLIANPSYFSNALINKWEEAGLFSCLSNPLQVEPILALLTMALKENKERLADELIKIIMLQNPEALSDKFSDFLLVAYQQNNHVLFGLLMSYVKNFDIPGLNMPLNNGQTFLTDAISCYTLFSHPKADFVNILLKYPSLNLEVIGQQKTPLQWAVDTNSLVHTREILNGLYMKSADLMRTAVRRDDVLYSAYSNGNSSIFKCLLNTVADLTHPGLETADNRLQGGSFIQDNVMKNHHHYTSMLVDKGLAIPSALMSKYRNQYEYDRIRNRIKELPNNDKNKEQEIYLKIIEATVDLDEKYRRLGEVPRTEDDTLTNYWNSLSTFVGRKKQQAFIDNSENRTGFSEMHAFCKNNNMQSLLEFINSEEELASGVRPDSITGKTALHYAFSNPYYSVEIIKNLISTNKKYAECLNLKDFSGRVPLHYACMSGYFPIVKELVDRGLGLEPSIDKVALRTPLHYAFLAVDSRIATQLLTVDSMQMVINNVDIYGRTALHYALITSKTPLITQLVKLGAMTSKKDFRGETPLHLACRQGNDDAIKALMTAPGFMNALFIKNNENLTPIDLLRSDRNTNTSRFLRTFYKLASRAKSLESDSNGISQHKATAINILLDQLLAADDNKKVQLLSQINIEDTESPLFKPRRTYLFFKASSPQETKTAGDILELKSAVGLQG